MSAITAIYYRDGRPIDRSLSDKMLAVLAHRGSDGVGNWCGESVALGHRMSWTTPESLLETLPLADESNDFVVTADARIDNRDELFESSGERVSSFQPLSALGVSKRLAERSCPDQTATPALRIPRNSIRNPRMSKTVRCVSDNLGPAILSFTGRTGIM